MIRDVAHLRTARLVLRPLTPADAPALVAGVGNYDVARWLAVVPFPYGLENARDFLASDIAQARLTWAICDGTGLVGLATIAGEFGYWLGRPAWGKGYATEAGRAAVDAAFADPTRRRLDASHMVGNDRSAHVLYKLGFEPLGTCERMFVAYGQPAPARLLTLSRRRWRGLRRTAAWSRPPSEGSAP